MCSTSERAAGHIVKMTCGKTDRRVVHPPNHWVDMHPHCMCVPFTARCKRDVWQTEREVVHPLNHLLDMHSLCMCALLQCLLQRKVWHERAPKIWRSAQRITSSYLADRRLFIPGATVMYRRTMHTTSCRPDPTTRGHARGPPRSHATQRSPPAARGARPGATAHPCAWGARKSLVHTGGSTPG